MTLRKLLFWGHLSMGLAAGLVIFTMCVTGIVLAFEPQIVAWSETDLRRIPVPPGAARLPIEALVARAQAAMNGARVSGIAADAAPGAALTVMFDRAGGLFMNPYTGDIVGKDSRTHALMHKIEQWHRWLGSRDIGRPVTGACNLMFFAMTLSGFYLWWPRQWNWGAIKGVVFFRRGLSGKARDWNWHNVIGIWCAAVLMVLTLSGMVMSYPWANALLYRLAGSEPPAQGPNRGAAAAGARKSEPDPRPPAALGSLWAAAISQSPGWKAIHLRLPARPHAPVAVSIQEASAPSRFTRSQLTLDPESAQIQKWEPYARANRGRRWRVLARTLHTGEAAGWFGQLIAGAASAGGAALVWTGWALAWRRFSDWRRGPPLL